MSPKECWREYRLNCEHLDPDSSEDFLCLHPKHELPYVRFCPNYPHEDLSNSGIPIEKQGVLLQRGKMVRARSMGRR